MESVVAETEDIQSSINLIPSRWILYPKSDRICAVCRLILFSVYKAFGSALEMRLQGKERTVAMIKKR